MTAYILLATLMRSSIKSDRHAILVRRHLTIYVTLLASRNIVWEKEAFHKSGSWNWCTKSTQVMCMWERDKDLVSKYQLNFAHYRHKLWDTGIRLLFLHDFKFMVITKLLWSNFQNFLKVTLYLYVLLLLLLLLFCFVFVCCVFRKSNNYSI